MRTFVPQIITVFLAFASADCALAQSYDADPSLLGSKLWVVYVADSTDPAIGQAVARSRRDFQSIMERGIEMLRAEGSQDAKPRIEYRLLDGALVTRANIMAALVEIRPTEKDGVLFYYAGHGAQQDGGGQLLTLTNGEIVDLDTISLYLASKTPRLIVMLLDACSVSQQQQKLFNFERILKSLPNGIAFPEHAGDPNPAAIADLFFHSRGFVELRAASYAQVGLTKNDKGTWFCAGLCQLLTKPMAYFDGEAGPTRINAAAANWEFTSLSGTGKLLDVRTILRGGLVTTPPDFEAILRGGQVTLPGTSASDFGKGWLSFRGSGTTVRSLDRICNRFVLKEPTFEVAAEEHDFIPSGANMVPEKWSTLAAERPSDYDWRYDSTPSLPKWRGKVYANGAQPVLGDKHVSWGELHSKLAVLYKRVFDDDPRFRPSISGSDPYARLGRTLVVSNESKKTAIFECSIDRYMFDQPVPYIMTFPERGREASETITITLEPGEICFPFKFFTRSVEEIAATNVRSVHWRFYWPTDPRDTWPGMRESRLAWCRGFDINDGSKLNPFTIAAPDDIPERMSIDNAAYWISLDVLLLPSKQGFDVRTNPHEFVSALPCPELPGYDAETIRKKHIEYSRAAPFWLPP